MLIHFIKKFNIVKSQHKDTVNILTLYINYMIISEFTLILKLKYKFVMLRVGQREKTKWCADILLSEGAIILCVHFFTIFKTRISNNKKIKKITNIL